MKIKFVYLYLLVLYLSMTFVVIATDGFIAYRSNSGASVTNSPKIRYWNNTNATGNGTFDGEIELNSTGSPVRDMVLKQSPINSKMILIVESDNGNLSGYVCMKNCANSSNWVARLNLAFVWSTAPTPSSRRFDLSFESNSGDALLVYGILDTTNVSRDIGYIELFDYNTSFSNIAEQYLDDSGHGNDLQYSWMESDNNPLNNSNEIIISGFDSNNNDINAWVWNGTTFGTINEISAAATATSGFEALAVKYAGDGSKGMVVGADGTTGNVNSEYWSSGAWTVVTAFDPISGGGGQNNDEQWFSMDADPTTDDIQLAFSDSGSVLHTSYWNGSTWTLTASIDGGIDSATLRPFDFAWLPVGNSGRLIWDTDTGGTTLSARICTPQCTAATQTFSTYAGTGAWLSLFRNPSASEIVDLLGFRLNSAFSFGAFRYNGSTLNYTNYGDSVVATTTSVSTFESYYFDFRRDIRPPSINLSSPNTSLLVTSINYTFFNFTSNEYLPGAIVEFNNTNYSMIGNDTNWYYNLTDISEGFYYYIIYATDYANNTNVTQRFNVTINFPPNVTLVHPPNNTLNLTSHIITFYYNVTDSYILDNVSSCSLIIDGAFVINTTGPINETYNNNFTYAFNILGQHNWSVFCNDTFNFNHTSEVRNITILITPQLSYFTVDEGIYPTNDLLLNAGGNRTLNCSITASDPEGINNILNASAKFYYYLSNPLDSDNNNTHYSNNDCVISDIGTNNKTFSCLFYIEHYANNGTWYCNATVFNSYGIFNSTTQEINISPLYAINISDGISFGEAQAGFVSNNISINISNFGNMPVAISLQGYARILGDGVGMNCSDNTNITIGNIKFSYDSSHAFIQKTPLDGTIQNLNIQIPKRIDSTPSINYTYWQINPDPGSKDRLCSGFVIFTAEAS